MFWVINFVCCFFLVNSTVWCGDSSPSTVPISTDIKEEESPNSTTSVVMRQPRGLKKRKPLNLSAEDLLNTTAPHSRTSRQNRRENTNALLGSKAKSQLFSGATTSEPKKKTRLFSITESLSASQNSFNVDVAASDLENSGPSVVGNYESLIKAHKEMTNAEFNNFFSWEMFEILIRSNDIDKFLGQVLHFVFTKQNSVEKNLEKAENPTVRLHAQKLDKNIWKLFNKKLLFESFGEVSERAKKLRRTAREHQNENSLQYGILKTFINQEFDVDGKIENGWSLFKIAQTFATKPVIFALSNEIYWLLIYKEALVIENSNILLKQDLARAYVSRPVVPLLPEDECGLSEDELQKKYDEIYSLIIDKTVLSNEHGQQLTEKQIKKIYYKNTIEKIIEDQPEKILEAIRRAIDENTINRQDDKDRTWAHYILKLGLEFENCLPIQEALLSGKPNFNIVDKNGNSPLHLMVLTGCGKFPSEFCNVTSNWMFPAYLKYAIENNYNFSLKNEDGFTLLHLLARSETRIFSPILLLLAAAKENNLKLELNTLSSSGATALYYAIEKRWIEEAKALLEAGADPLTGSQKRQPICLVASIIQNSKNEPTKFKNELKPWKKFLKIIKTAQKQQKNSSTTLPSIKMFFGSNNL